MWLAFKKMLIKTNLILHLTSVSSDQKTTSNKWLSYGGGTLICC